MIKVNVTTKNDLIENIQIQGHAMYDEYGKDIVCSAVSSIVITTVNAIVEICPNTIMVDQLSNKTIISIIKYDDICVKLIKNMLALLGELSDKYPKNITIK